MNTLVAPSHGTFTDIDAQALQDILSQHLKSLRATGQLLVRRKAFWHLVQSEDYVSWKSPALLSQRLVAANVSKKYTARLLPSSL